MNSLNLNEEYTILVKNYGLPAYAATQETNQFIDLLKLGHRPSLCIFMDGINTGPIWDGAELSMELSRIFSNYDNTSFLLTSLFQKTPLSKVLTNTNGVVTLEVESLIFPLNYSNQYNQKIVNRFIENARIRQKIAELYDIEILQFLQSNVYINYNQEFTIDERKRQYENSIFQRQNYPELYSKIMNTDTSFIDLFYLFNEYPYVSIVDEMHYSPDFNNYLQQNIQQYFNVDNLKKYRFEDIQSTGKKFDY